jgi:aminocarboxymuconate-semialdehyde decarboxylase
MLKIDMHAHILPPDWPDLSSKYDDPGIPRLERSDGRSIIMRNGGFFREIWPNIWNVEQRIEEYAAFGVDVQVISTVPLMFSYHSEPSVALELSRFLNDHVAEQQNLYPKNVIALGTVPMQDADVAIAELERLKNDLGVPGIQIGSNINDRNLDDPEIFRVFEAATDLGMAVMVHPWEMMGRNQMQDYWLSWLVGMPAELSRAICSMIFGGVLERLPGLRLCFAHGGGSFPFTVGRIEHGFNMRPDLVATRSSVNPREYLGRFYVDSVTHDPVALAYLLDVIGDRHIMLGTDYPFPLGEQQPGSAIDALDLEQPTRERLYATNALEWLGLDEEQFL